MMKHPHALKSLAFVSLTVAIVAIAPDRPFSAQVLRPTGMLIVKFPEPIVQLAARKGTRNFEGTPSTYKTERTLGSCMEAWDSATRITKERWREICKRQLKEEEASRER